jgi:hypothetical protein
VATESFFWRRREVLPELPSSCLGDERSSWVWSGLRARATKGAAARVGWMECLAARSLPWLTPSLHGPLKAAGALSGAIRARVCYSGGNIAGRHCNTAQNGAHTRCVACHGATITARWATKRGARLTPSHETRP